MNHSCIDHSGLSIASGRRFFPDKHDLCNNCLCNDGVPEMCKQVMCKPPPCKVYEALPDTCCQYHCLLPDIGDHTALMPVSEINNTDLAVRISASALTSALMIMLVIFMMYRLRRQRMVLLMRNMQLQTMSEMAELHNGHFDLTGAYPFLTYQEPPPPYTPPKPADDFNVDEPPPPYDSLAEPQNTNDQSSETTSVNTHRRTVSAGAGVTTVSPPTGGQIPCQCVSDDTNNNAPTSCVHSTTANESVRDVFSLPRGWRSSSRDPVMGQSRQSFRQSSQTVRGRYWTSCDEEPLVHGKSYVCNTRTENRLAGRQLTDRTHTDHHNVILLEQRHFVDHN